MKIQFYNKSTNKPVKDNNKYFINSEGKVLINNDIKLKQQSYTVELEDFMELVTNIEYRFINE